MAARLKLEHELRGHFVPKIRGQMKKVGGLGGDNHEAWMYIAPTPDTLRNSDRARGVRVDGVNQAPSKAGEDSNTCFPNGATREETGGYPSDESFVSYIRPPTKYGEPI